MVEVGRLGDEILGRREQSKKLFLGLEVLPCWRWERSSRGMKRQTELGTRSCGLFLTIRSRNNPKRSFDLRLGLAISTTSSNSLDVSPVADTTTFRLPSPSLFPCSCPLSRAPMHACEEEMPHGQNGRELPPLKPRHWFVKSFG